MKVYNNEDLTPETAAIYHQARKSVIEMKLWAAYTRDGQLKNRKKDRKLKEWSSLHIL